MHSLDKPGLNKDICFHSGSAGTRSLAAARHCCRCYLRFSETISRHLLAADCSGRFLLLLSPPTPPSGPRKVLHRSPWRARQPGATWKGQEIDAPQSAGCLFSCFRLIMEL